MIAEVIKFQLSSRPRRGAAHRDIGYLLEGLIKKLRDGRAAASRRISNGTSGPGPHKIDSALTFEENCLLEALSITHDRQQMEDLIIYGRRPSDDDEEKEGGMCRRNIK